MKKLALLTGTTIVLLVILFYIISGIFLTCNKSVNSPYVLLEGWISHYNMEFAANYILANNYDSVFVVGMINQGNTVSIQQAKKTKKLKGYDNTYALFTNGILGFKIPTEKLKDNSTINIKMRGTSALEHFPHYQVFANEHLMGSGFVNEKDTTYKFNLSNNIADSITYVSINFDNHIMPSLGDRHLLISDINIDMVNIDSISVDNFYIDNKVKMYFEFISGLNRIKNYLADRGYDTSRLKLVGLEPKPYNKSIAIAKGAKDYFAQSKIKRINIITIRNHSSRSYLNFKNAVKNVEFGCIIIHNHSEFENSLKFKIDERISLLLTWMYWWFH